ncbi:MAG: hypothetical protein JSS00_15895 [Proteobacteria bacterium]|nr:hypothetical protein [Pseudomonadota bacterium]
MSAARPSLVYDAAFEEARERRAYDRRSGDRRSRREGAGLRLDPLFAATLVNHVAAPERIVVKGYRYAHSLRAGIAINLKV